MRTANDKNDPKSNGPIWEYLAEYPLNELLVDMDLRDKPEEGLLVRSIRELGIQLELVDVIERKLIGFASQALMQLNQRRFEAPTYVRLYCQKETPDDSNPVNMLDRHKSRQTLESAQIIDRRKPKINGGWGYFLVERGVSSKTGTSATLLNWVDLYLYQEGE